MEAYLVDKGYAAVMISRHFPEGTPQAEIYAYHLARVEPSLKASAIIRLSLEDGPLIQVKGITDAIIIWNRLRTLYEPKGFSSEFLLSKELFLTTLAK